MAHKTFFVAGATGIQGGAVVSALSKLNPKPQIHVIARDPNSTASKILAAHQHIKVFKGDLDDEPSLVTAMTGCTAAFFNVTPNFADLSAEARYAQKQVAAAEKAGIKRVLYSSSSAMIRPFTDEVWTDYVPNNPQKWMTIYLTSKRACEEAVEKAEFSEGWTLLRSASYFTNYIEPHSAFMYPELKTKQTIVTALDLDLKIPCLDPEDIGTVVAKILTVDEKAFADQFRGKRIPMAKEYLSTRQVVEKLNQALGGGVVTLIGTPEEEAKGKAANGDPITDSQLWQNRYPVQLDLDEVEAFGIDTKSMTTLEQFLARNRSKVLAAVGQDK